MKIIIIGPAHPYRGGIADTNESFATALQHEGHDVQIFTFKLQYPSILYPGKTQFRKEGVGPSHLKIKRVINSLNPLNWFMVSNRIKKEKPDLIIIRYWIPFLAPCLGSIARITGKKHKVIALCDNIVPHEKRFGDLLLTNYFLGSCQGFITMSQLVHDDLNRHCTKPNIKLYHPINYNLGEILSKETARKKLNLDPHGKYVLSFGFVRKYKGLELLLEAFCKVVKQDPSIKLIVVGEFFVDPRFYDRLIEDLGIQEHVMIKSGFVPSSEVAHYFCSSDFLALTYHHASQTGVGKMAYYFHTPILATNVGGLPEIVIHNKTGYITQKNPEDISTSILEMYNKNQFEDFSKHIEQEKSKYNWETFAQKCIAFANSIEVNQ